MKGILTTDVEFGNDGALYVLDWVASWGGVGKGRIYKFTDPERQHGAASGNGEADLRRHGEAAREELAKLLAHADMRVRQAAQFELAGRGAGKACPPLPRWPRATPNRSRACTPSGASARSRRSPLAGQAARRRSFRCSLMRMPKCARRRRTCSAITTSPPSAKARRAVEGQENRVPFFAAWASASSATRRLSSRSARCSRRTTTRTRSCATAASWA